MEQVPRKFEQEIQRQAGCHVYRQEPVGKNVHRLFSPVAASVFANSTTAAPLWRFSDGKNTDSGHARLLHERPVICALDRRRRPACRETVIPRQMTLE